MRKMFSEKQIDSMIDGKVVDKELVSYDGENLKDANGNTIEVGGSAFVNNIDLLEYKVGDKVLLTIMGDTENDQGDVLIIIGNIITNSVDNTRTGSIVIAGGLTFRFVRNIMELTTMLENIIDTNQTINYNLGIPSISSFVASSYIDSFNVVKL